MDELISYLSNLGISNEHERNSHIHIKEIISDTHLVTFLQLFSSV